MRRCIALFFLLASVGCSSTTDPVGTAADTGRPDVSSGKDSGTADTRPLTDTGTSVEDTSEPPVDSAPDASCDGTVCGGACVDLSSDAANCGMCGKSCGAGACISGACVCPTGTYACSGACADLLTDNKNCGSCGKACATGEVCKFAACEKVCTAPTIKCFGECVDVTTDALNCGSCGKTCATSESCVASACVCGTKACGTYETCVSGSCTCTKTTCSGTCTDTTTDAANCGSCGNACATGVPCIAGACLTSTTVTFPQTTSKTSTRGSIGTLGTGGGTAHYVSGDYVEDTYTRGASVARLDLDIRMYDGTTTYCTVGTLNWAVKINGTTVGTYSFVGGSGGTDVAIKQTYSFAPIAPISGQVTIRLEATSTVCSGGSSWNWYPGGTAILY